MESLLGTALAFSLAILPLAAQAQTGGGPRAEHLARALDLTETQRARIRTLREAHRPGLLLRRASARQTGTALRRALRDGATPEARLRTLSDQAAAARFEWLLARRALRQEVRAVLTPEQRERAAELRGAARAANRGHRRPGRPAGALAG